MPEVLTQKRVEQVLRDPARQEVADLRVRGLALRGSQRGATWVVRSDRGRKTVKIPIGAPPEMTLAAARQIAAAAVDRIRAGLDLDARWIEAQRIAAGVQHEQATTVPTPRVRPRTWTYEDAVQAYLDGLVGKRREATITSYRQKLTHPALREAFGGRAVVDIERRHASKVVETVGREKSTTAENMVGAIGRLWSWMAEDSQQAMSGLRENTMIGLKAPSRPMSRKRGAHIRNPEMETIGRIVAACRCGAMHPSVARALEIVVLTAQRRETVASAWVSELDLDAKVPVWKISGDRMKMGLDHWIPLSPRAVQVFRDAVQEAGSAGSPYAFPQVRPRRRGEAVDHVHPDSLSHYMGYVSGTTPHRMRIAFTSNAGLKKEQAAVVLDHMEGRRDITDTHYNRDHRLPEKSEYLGRWEEALRPHVDAAVATTDPATVKETIRRKKKELSKGRRTHYRDRIREHVRESMEADARSQVSADEDRRIADEALEALRNGVIDLDEVRRRLRLDG